MRSSCNRAAGLYGDVRREGAEEGEKVYVLDLLEDRRVLGDTHAEKLLGSPVLVENIVGVLAEFFHVGADKHLTKLDKVAVVLVVDLDNTPRIFTSTDCTPVSGRHWRIGTNHSKGDLAGDFLSLCNSLLVLVLISRSLESVDIVMRDISQNLE